MKQHTIKTAPSGEFLHTMRVSSALRRSSAPAVWLWIGQHGSGLPDAVKHDGLNGKRTRAAAKKILPKLSAIEQDADAYGHALLLVTINSDSDDPEDLYNGTGTAWAKATAREVCGNLPHFWRLEYGSDDGTGIHVHLIVSGEARARASALGADVRLVDDLPKLARYLSKPRDARAARLNHKRIQDIDDHAAAAELYLVQQFARRELAGPKAKLPDGHRFENMTGLMCNGLASTTTRPEQQKPPLIVDTASTPCEQQVAQPHDQVNDQEQNNQVSVRQPATWTPAAPPANADLPIPGGQHRGAAAPP